VYHWDHELCVCGYCVGGVLTRDWLAALCDGACRWAPLCRPRHAIVCVCVWSHHYHQWWWEHISRKIVIQQAAFRRARFCFSATFQTRASQSLFASPLQKSANNMASGPTHESERYAPSSRKKRKRERKRERVICMRTLHCSYTFFSDESRVGNLVSANKILFACHKIAPPHFLTSFSYLSLSLSFILTFTSKGVKKPFLFLKPFVEFFYGRRRIDSYLIRRDRRCLSLVLFLRPSFLTPKLVHLVALMSYLSRPGDMSPKRMSSRKPWTWRRLEIDLDRPDWLTQIDKTRAIERRDWRKPRQGTKGRWESDLETNVLSLSPRFARLS